MRDISIENQTSLIQPKCRLHELDDEFYMHYTHALRMVFYKRLAVDKEVNQNFKLPTHLPVGLRGCLKQHEEHRIVLAASDIFVCS